MFSWEIAKYMDKPIETLNVIESNPIKAKVFAPVAFPDRDRFGARFEGWAFDRQTGRPPKHVVVTNSAGQIQGLARFTSSRKNVATRFDLDPETRLAFGGYIKDYVESETYIFYVILNDGLSAVRLPDP